MPIKIPRYYEDKIKNPSHLVMSHFHGDHFGGAVAFAEQVPILNWLGHGESVLYGKTDGWWKQNRRRGGGKSS